jgi:hypothetical protein
MTVMVSRHLTSQQLLALDIVLLDDPSGRRAWQEWHSLRLAGDVTAEEYPLLPLIYERAQGWGASSPLMPRLKGIYRRAWTKNQLLLHSFDELLDRFEQAGIPVMCLRDVAADLGCYAPVRLRSLDRLDLAVLPENLPRAISLLSALDWLPVPSISTLDTASFRQWETLQRFQNPARQILYLHWHVLPGVPSPEIDRQIWQSASSIHLNGRQMLMPDPESQLLLISLGVNPPSPQRLISLVDACLLLRSDVMDWNKLLESAFKFRLVLPLLTTLQRLNSVADDIASGWVIDLLASAKLGALCRLEQYADIQPAGGCALLPRVAKWLTRYCRFSTWNGVHPSPGSFLDFLACQLRLERRRDVIKRFFYSSG